MMNELWRTAAELTDSATAFVVITLIGARGHVPQDLGAKAIVTHEGLRQGTVGGGKVEAQAIEHAKAILHQNPLQPEVVTWNLNRDIGMTCGGEVTYLFEKYNPHCWSIAIFGAGHVAQALVRTLENLNCHLTCFDTRTEWIDKLPKAAKITRVISQDLPSSVETMGSSGNDTFFVVMTKGHATDLPILEKIYRTYPQAPYIGVMGSDVKALKMRHELQSRGIQEQLVKNLRSPIGLPIGSNAPYEIAISVIAELLQFRALWEEKLASRGQNAL